MGQSLSTMSSPATQATPPANGETAGGRAEGVEDAIDDASLEDTVVELHPILPEMTAEFAAADANSFEELELTIGDVFNVAGYTIRVIGSRDGEVSLEVTTDRGDADVQLAEDLRPTQPR